jgi:DNA-binding NarL/FixJ family response regulator
MADAHRAPRQVSAARLIIVDDHPIVRAGLRSLLERERGLAVVGEAANGREALALCRRLQPDLALIDVRMPELDGLAATRAIKQECPRICVIIVTVYEKPDYLYEAIKAGAAGYLLKDAPETELLTGIRRVLRGESLLRPTHEREILGRWARETERGEQPFAERLTRREHDVMRLLAQGLTNREIAAELVVSPGTIKVHVEHIIAKLGVSDRTQAAVRAIERGLVTPNSE